MNKKTVALMLALNMLMNPAMSLAAPTIPGFYGKVTAPAVNTLPQARGNSFTGVDSITTDSSKNQMVINQNQQYATINWDNFNIGAKATVYFKQQKDGVAQKDWVALNRIYSNDPSLIFGTLKADGKVYLLNQNGILFGHGAQVNVHTLIASSLSMTDDDFTKGFLRFKADSGSTPGAVSNSGDITTDNFGSVYLIAPNVENYGSIDARYGQIGLLAGNDVELAADPNIEQTNRWALLATINDTSGVAVNRSTGRLNADSGMIGMYGASVQQDGIIRAVTAIKRNGQIELLARDRIVTGAGSNTSTPITDSPETVAVNTADTTSTFSTGSVLLGGLAGGNSTVKRIEHYGAITVPSGTVTLNAEERVYLDSGSSIDVSGVWTDKQAKDAEVSSQLTSVTLRDAYNQKNGVDKGESVTVDPHNGSSIGDLSGAITSRQMTALDRSTTGGTIAINVSNGDLIAKEGSTLNFAGGGTHYSDGNMSVTKLLSGNTIYDISLAPENIAYNNLLGSFKSISKKFGLVGSWTGIYYGGGAALQDYSHSFTEGSNAGSLKLQAGSLVLNGAIKGGVERGFYQTLNAEQIDAYSLQKTSGLQEPTAGTLTIGTSNTPTPGQNDQTTNLVTRQVVLAAETVPLSSSFDPENTPVDATKRTVLSTRILNAAGLSNLSIYANTSITTEKGASIVLSPSGSFSAMARRIEHNGDISVSSGKVTLIAVDNATTYQDNTDKEFDADYTSKVYLATGSSISVAGERVDNLLAGKVGGKAIVPAHTTGGTITVEDASYSDVDGTTIKGLGLVVNKGAVLDVSGGYTISTSGKVTGGDAGSINLQGAVLVANGDFRGFSLPGRKGGTISLSADNVEVMPTLPAVLSQDFKTTTPIPEMTVNGTANQSKYLLIAGNRFDDSGFTNISLKSRNDLTVDSGVTIAPSRKKLQAPIVGGSSGSSVVATNLNATVSGQIGSDGSVAFNDVGASSVTLLSGQRLSGDDTTLPLNDSASVKIAANSLIRVAPGGGTITVQGPAVNIAGSLDAPSGTISITANNLDLVVSNGANISATGFNMPDATLVAKGITAGYKPLDAGTINLAANNGNLVLEEGSVIDVSGSTPVTVASGNGTAVTTITEVANNPGTINISYMNEFSNAGILKARRFQDNLTGGTISIKSKGTTEGIAVSGDLINGYLNSGFDSLTFQSSMAVNLSGSMDLSIRRGLTLDAPMITGSGADTVKLAAPWIKIANSTTDRPAADTDTTVGSATLSLNSEWLDLEGDIALNCFAKVDLTAERDMRLADRQYQPNNSNYWSGRLATAGDLTLTADRIYPKMTLSTFVDSIGTTQLVSIPSDYSITVGGKLTTLPSADPTSGLPVYSAGGSLTINAAGGFEHNGTIVVPMGTITINNDPAIAASSRVFLGQGSVLSTAGSTDVVYGFLDENSSMRTKDKITESNSSGNAVSGAPEKNITINGNELIVKEGATIDISGGGSVTAYAFQAGTEGSVNPFTVKGRMVIVPGHLYDVPGAEPGSTVHLNGGNGLPAGDYTILPASYAFLPGAYVISDIGTTKPGGSYKTSDGTAVVSGYSTVAGTGISSNRLHYYSVRDASDLRKEGNFTLVSKSGADAGRLKINTNTTVLNGAIAASAAAGGNGGALVFGGNDLTVKTDVIPLPVDFGFDDNLSADLVGTLQIKADSLAGNGLRAITLGTDKTKKITLTKGSSLTAQEITLQTSSADDSQINIDENISDKVVISGGTVSISSGGTVSIGKHSEVFAGNDLTLEAGKLLLSGALKGNSSTLNVSSAKLVLGIDNVATDKAADGLSLGDGFFSHVSGFTNMRLKSGSDIRIRNDFNLAVSDTLRIDAARIVADATQPVSATFSGKKFEMFNSGATAGSDVPAGGGTLKFTAERGSIGNGAVRIAGFGSTTFDLTNDLTFLGKGALNTDGNLYLKAARITAGPSYVQTQTASSQMSYQAANFVVDSGNNALTLSNSDLPSTAITTGYLGGSLSFQGRTITSSATIELPAGRVSLEATGSAIGEGVTLLSGGRILAPGHDYPAANDGGVEHEPGGVVTLRADNGLVNVAEGAVIDVSAPGAGDAGSITLIAPVQGVTVNGDIKGNATQGGVGGSLAIDSSRIDVAGLAGNLQSGGFNNSLKLRARTGDVLIGSGLTLQAVDVKLTADSGNLTLDGAIDASSRTGGRVELNAGGNLNLNGTIDASGTAGKGGDVLLNVSSYDRTALPNAVNGTLNFATGSSIDVSGTTSGGTLAFRAPQNDSFTDVNMTLNGTVKGASLVTAEAVRTHLYTNNVTINTAFQTALNTSDIAGFMGGSANVAAVTSRLLGGIGPDGWDSSRFNLLPGIELQSTGNITLVNDWDLSGANWRTGGVPEGAPGVLTLRAAGDLSINNKLVDHPTTFSSLSGLTGRTSWGLNLIAGGDLASADLMAVRQGRGTLTVDGTNNKTLVYTESAPIRFASGGDTVLGKGLAAYYMINGDLAYTLASYSGSIRGVTGGSLYVNGGAVETATGDITLKVNSDLNLSATSTPGSIRTTGFHAPVTGQTYTDFYSRYWEYAGGGNISLDVAGSVNGQVNAAAWDSVTSVRTSSGNNYYWSANFGGRTGKPTSGLATMGGGSLYVRSGGDFNGQAGTFGNNDNDSGSLTILSGGDLTGRFNVRSGEGVIHAAGNIGAPSAEQVIGAFDVNLSVIAQGGVTLGTVYNPTIGGDSRLWQPTYGPNARLFVMAVNGDLSVTGNNPYSKLTESTRWREQIFPASAFLFAGQDILFNNQISLSPSLSGNLQLEAGRDINGSYLDSNGAYTKSLVVMSDADPNKFYASTSAMPSSDFFDPHTHSNPSTLRSSTPISIEAGRDLENIQIVTPKVTNVSAGRDIRDIYYVGQNLKSTDISSVSAGRDIYFSSVSGSSLVSSGLEQGGSGAFIVQAGDTIDLGTSKGIQTYGNAFNVAALDPVKGSDLFVVAGSDSLKSPETIVKLIEGDAADNIKGLREYGVEYSELKSQGDAVGAQQRLDEARALLIDPFFGGETNNGAGTINMTSSQISTNAGQDNIYIMARSQVNVGKTTLILDKAIAAKKQANTGIYTAKGGAINIFSGGDLNVNEARVMSFLSGDLTIWSDHGNVNAGRGSKTAISTNPPTLQLVPGTGIKNSDGSYQVPPQYQVVFSPPSVGSGIRTLTYSPNLGESAPESGNIYVFAPEGSIDAGEAGIAGNKVVLGATAILNAQNISFSAGSVGVPTSENTVNLGAITGAGSVAETSKMIDRTTLGGTGDTSKTLADKMAQILSGWLDVKVIDFDTESSNSGE